jgi:DNA gyrase subunit A
MMGTRRGVVKKTALSAFSNPRAGGIIAMGVEEGDAVIAVQLTDGTSQILIGTRDGMAIRFAEDDVRAMGRTAYGVRGVSLRGDDYVVGMEAVKPGGTILTVTEHGYGKRTEVEEYRMISRGGLGVINIETSERNGQVVAVAYVEPSDEVLLVTQQGMMLRTAADDIRMTGRAAQGVRLIDIDADDRVVGLAKLEPEPEAAAEAGEEAPVDSDAPAEPGDGDGTPPEA